MCIRMNESWHDRLTRTFRPCTDQILLGNLGSESRRMLNSSELFGAPSHQYAAHAEARISTGCSLDKVGHRPHPSPRSLRSQKCVYARARDASVKTQPRGLVMSEDLYEVYESMFNMFAMFIGEELSSAGRTVEIRAWFKDIIVLF